MVITITIEGDEDGVVGLLRGHVMAFFNADPGSMEPAEFVRLVVVDHGGKIDTDSSVTITSIYTTGSLYRSDEYISAETPYRALWRSLKTVLSPRLYEIMKSDFDLKNKSYSKMKYNAKKDVQQERMF